MKPEKPLITDWYVTNYEGIIYLTNLEWNRHFVIHGHMLDSQWIHHCTNRRISVWKRTPAVLFHKVENSFTELIMFLFHNFPLRFSHWLIGGPESKLQWKTSWSQGFMLAHSTPLVESPRHCQNCRRPLNLQGWFRTTISRAAIVQV